MTTLLIDLASPRQLLNGAPVHAASRAISLVSGVSTPSRRADHERQGQPSQSRPLFPTHVQVARRPTLVRGPVRHFPLGGIRAVYGTNTSVHR